MQMKIYYSCLLDASPVFYYQAWIWVNSLLDLSSINPAHIYVHHTKEVDKTILQELAALEVNLVQVERFGDGKYCNKIAQLDTEIFEDADSVFFMDTDMIVLGDIEHIAETDKIGGKVVDGPNPTIDILKMIYESAGFSSYPEIVKVDCGDAVTFRNNFNGGLYVVPGKFIKILSEKWKMWALWLLDNIQLLKQAGKSDHVDQIAFSMAVHELGITLHILDKKYNYPAHLDIVKTGYPLIIHFHKNISKMGLLSFDNISDENFAKAVEDANSLISKSFNNRLFWSFRYAAYPELGSGFGSRGENLEYKRQLLLDHQIPLSPSVLDVGCGDLEVIKTMDFNNYTGIDVSPAAVSVAKTKRPDYRFMLFDQNFPDDIPTAHTVLCFEVLIHQQNEQEYYQLLNFLCEKVEVRLIVSGYEKSPENVSGNHMIKFYEPLTVSLEKIGKFKFISKIGRHSAVDIILAEV